jgi:hypothetical protein
MQPPAVSEGPYRGCREPYLEYLAQCLLRRMKQRVSRITKKRADYNQAFTVRDIKVLLLSMDTEAIDQKNFVDILAVSGVPFPDTELNCSGIYAGMHVNSEDDSALTVGQALRVAKVLSRPGSVAKVLKRHKQFAQSHTATALTMMGQTWKTLLGDRWHDFEELEDEIESSEEDDDDDEYNEEVKVDDEEEEDDEEDEGDEDFIPPPSQGRTPPPLPLDDRLDEKMPWSPIYVGWGLNPSSRLSAHKRRLSL